MNVGCDVVSCGTRRGVSWKRTAGPVALSFAAGSSVLVLPVSGGGEDGASVGGERRRATSDA